MIVFFFVRCYCIEVSTKWKTFPYPDNKAYDAAFRVGASSDTNSPDYTVITTDAGSYYGTDIKNVLDGARKTYWESNKQFNNNYKVAKVSMVFKKHVMEDITRIAMLGRQSSSKGIPLAFDILIAENVTTEKTLIYSADYKTHTYSDYMQIDIPKSTFGYMEFLITRIEGGEGRPNLAELAFYKEDSVDLLADRLFTDGTWSKLGISLDEAKKFVKLVETHPAKASLAKKIEVLKEIIMTGDKLEKSVFEFDDFTNFINGAQHGAGAYGGMPVGYYLHNKEVIELYCEINTKDIPWVQTLKYLDKNWDFMSDNIRLKTGYNKFVTPQIDVNNLSLSTSMITVLYAGYRKKPEDVAPPKCRISGGNRFPMYIDGKTDPCEFEKSLIAYQKHIDCNRLHFQTKNTEAKYDIAILRSAQNSIIVTATSLLGAMKKNRNAGRTFADTMHVWERMPEQYQDYDGFYENDPQPFHRLSKAMHLSILMAQNGKPYAWADGFFTGYNDNKNKEGTCISKGGFSDSMPYYKSFAKDGWGYYHEWGHIYDNGKVKVGETTNNLYSLMMERYLGRRPNRLERDGYISAFYDYNNQPGKLHVWHQLIMLRQFEMFYGQDRFHKEFMRWLREGNFNKHADSKQLEENARWPFAATLFSGYDVFDIFKPHKYNWTKTYQYTDPILKNMTLKKLPNTIHHANDRFQYNLEVKDQKGCNLNENNKMYIKQMKVIDGKTTITLGIKGIENEFVEILGYEMKNIDGSLEKFSPNNGITVNFGKDIDYIVTPVTLKLRRLPPARITASGSFEFVDQSRWKITTWPQGVGSAENTKIGDAIDSNENSCYFSPKVDYDHGFLLDLGEETDFSGFKYHIDGKSWGHGKNVTLEYSLDNVTWQKLPRYPNASFVLEEKLTSSKPKYQVYLTSMKARYIRAIQYGMDTQNTRHFRVCDFKLIKAIEMSIADKLDDPDYLEMSDICDETRDQSIFLDKSRYGYIEQPSKACEVPLNTTEDEWASEFEPIPDFHWPDEQDQQGDGGKERPIKSNSTAIGIGVAAAVIVVAAIIGIVYFIRKNRSIGDSDLSVKNNFTA